MKNRITISLSPETVAALDAIAAQEGAERAAAAKGPNRSGIVETILNRELEGLAEEGSIVCKIEALAEHFPNARAGGLKKLYPRLVELTEAVSREEKIVKGYQRKYGTNRKRENQL